VPGPPTPKVKAVAYRHRVYPEHRLGVLHLSGVVDVDDLLGGAGALYRDPVWRPPYSAVWDFRAVTELALCPEDVERVLVLLRSLRGRIARPGRSAVVAAREVDELVGRLLVCRLQRERGGAPPREARVFCSGLRGVAEGAAAWLGVPARLLGPALLGRWAV
jgi:hypothetical protein